MRECFVCHDPDESALLLLGHRRNKEVCVCEPCRGVLQKTIQQIIEIKELIA